MKFTFTLILSLIVYLSQGQSLKLSVGQSFAYEATKFTSGHTEMYSYSNYDYWSINFVVSEHENGLYKIRATPKRFIRKIADGFQDSNLSFDEQQENFWAFACKINTLSTFDLWVNDNREIVKVDGLEKIKKKLLTKLTQMNIPEGGQKFRDLANGIISARYYEMLCSFFKPDGEFAYHNNSNEGLILSSSLDTVEVKQISIGKLTEENNNLTKFNLVIVDGKPTALHDKLLIEAKEKINYQKYSSSISKARNKITKLMSLYDRDKGSQTIEEKVMKSLDSLDRGFAYDNFEYLGEKLRVLAYVGTGYEELLDKVPYEFLTEDNQVESKLVDDIEIGDFTNAVKAINLLFTKFKGTGYYPLNMYNISNSIHNSFGKIVHLTKNSDTLKIVLKTIQDIEALRIPTATELFRGLKTYTQAKLANNKKELSDVVATRFNSLFDMSGRYHILIYDELAKKRLPDSLKLTYIDHVIELGKQKIDLVSAGKIDKLDSFILRNSLVRNKVIYKKNLADAYYRKSKLRTSDSISYLIMAADYMPTQQDLFDNDEGLKSEYRFTPYVSYNDIYLAAGGESDLNADEKLKRYVETVIIEPERYEMLKDKYTKFYPNGIFKDFFTSALQKTLPKTPVFSLTERNGSNTTETDLRAKFVFVDFWGTWCGACVDEIDKIQAVYSKNPNPERLMVTTIACYDKKKNVDDFMAKRGFSYPVLMSDGKVEHDFKVTEYPTKVLLLPIGVYLTIPNSTNYNVLLKKYLAWEM
jgi:thiol-disulfide isomerase/thioredoxin